MHSALRLRPPGEAVCRIVIHLSSLIILITLSFPQSRSITITARSVEEWPGLLKWAATGLSMFLRFMSERWLFSLSFSACSVLPTYCWPHRLHWIRYTTSFDLQVAAVRRVYVLPVQWLVNMSVVNRAGQVLHREKVIIAMQSEPFRSVYPTHLVRIADAKCAVVRDSPSSSVYLSVCLSASLSVCLSVCLSFCLSVCM